MAQLGLDSGRAPDAPVHHGGPVEPGRGFVLHSDDWGGQDTIAVSGLGAMTGTIDVLRAIAEGRGPSRFLVALGYAGWGAGQLDDEMTRHGWFAAPGDPSILFDTKAEDRWASSFRAAGIDPRLLAAQAGAA
jgi:putative transcriptional regulator